MFSRFLALLGTLVCLVPIAHGEREFPDSAQAFPATVGLPDLFTFDDGSQVEGLDDWKCRRKELIAPLLHYQYGSMPPRPDMVAAKIGRISEHASGHGTVTQLTLIIDSKKKLEMRAVLYARTDGPHPVIIEEEGNPGDVNYPRVGSFGSVAHAFEIGRHKVSNAEYANFLKAVARESDPHSLYDPRMQINRGGQEKRFAYTAYPASKNAAVTYVSWRDALRYCNWLHGRDAEQGAYELSTGLRQPGAEFFLPTADEWHKAAYYDPQKKAYHLLPLRNAHELHDGEVPPPKSRYGMLSAADPIWEWTESKFGEQFRCLRSDSWFQGNNHQAKGHFYSNPDLELGHVGFRVARRAE